MKKPQLRVLVGAATLAVACLSLVVINAVSDEPQASPRVVPPVHVAQTTTTTATATPTTTPTESATPKPKPTPTPTPTEEPISYSVRCGGDTYLTYQEAWEEWDGDGSCSVETKYGSAETQAMKDALEYFKKGYSNDEALEYIFENCAEIGAGALNDEDELFGFNLYEVGAAIRLCPDAPNIEHATALVESGEQDEAWAESGQMFRGGAFKVGDEIAPGSYYAERSDGFEACYWERLDAAGNIIANNFISGGFRAEVYIDASDYSFSSEGCGAWRPM